MKSLMDRLSNLFKRRDAIRMDVVENSHKPVPAFDTRLINLAHAALVVALLVYYFDLAGPLVEDEMKNPTRGDGLRDFLGIRIFFTLVLCPFLDGASLLLTVINYVRMPPELFSDYLLTTQDHFGLAGKWCTDGLKYFLFAQAALLSYKYIKTGSLLKLGR